MIPYAFLIYCYYLVHPNHTYQIEPIDWNMLSLTLYSFESTSWLGWQSPNFRLDHAFLWSSLCIHCIRQRYAFWLTIELSPILHMGFIRFIHYENDLLLGLLPATFLFSNEVRHLNLSLMYIQIYPNNFIPLFLPVFLLSIQIIFFIYIGGRGLAV